VDLRVYGCEAWKFSSTHYIFLIDFIIKKITFANYKKQKYSLEETLVDANKSEKFIHHLITNTYYTSFRVLYQVDLYEFV
jgi:hypothetical protein